MNRAKKNIMFYDICRLCLDEPGSNAISETKDLIENIYKCTGVKITKSDTLPQKVCSTCLHVIDSSIQLRIIASKSDQYLKSLFNEDDSNETDGELGSSKSIVEGDKTLQSKVVNSSKFVTVRQDLFQSSTSEASTENEAEIPVKNKKIKIRNKKDGSVFFECKICKKTFDKWKKIYLHLRFHNKTILCPLDACGKTFATKGDLEKHTRSHTGEKPYICDECDKRFSQKVSLKSHKTTVHKICF